MKKIGIVTLYGNSNYGNKLQNYAVQKIIKDLGDNSVETIKINYSQKGFYGIIRKCVKNFVMLCSKVLSKMHKNNKEKNYKEVLEIRLNNFKKFDEKIVKRNHIENAINPSRSLKDEYDYFVVGSDQVWNPNHMGKEKITEIFLLSFANDEQKISFSASFAVDFLPKNAKQSAKVAFDSFKAISVREKSGKQIVEELTNRKDIKILLDPTMILPIEEWDKIMEKPKEIEKLCNTEKKFILNYFLGRETFERNQDEIKRIANENNCEIINILDKNDKFYTCGPTEFIWLEKNAFLVCTDSFHSSVFAILYDTPFIVFNREDGQKGINNMNSRLDTLLEKFDLKGRYFTGKISKDLLIANYTNKEEILKLEREKANIFLRKAIDIEY